VTLEVKYPQAFQFLNFYVPLEEKAKVMRPYHKALASVHAELIFSGLLHSGNGSDFSVVVDSTTFKLHRFVISFRFPKLLELTTIECSSVVFRQLVDFMYTDQIKTTSLAQVFPLYQLAKEIGFDGCAHECLVKMLDSNFLEEKDARDYSALLKAVWNAGLKELAGWLIVAADLGSRDLDGEEYDDSPELKQFIEAIDDEDSKDETNATHTILKVQNLQYPSVTLLLEHLFKSGDHSDVHITFEGEKFFLHQFVLDNRWPTLSQKSIDSVKPQSRISLTLFKKNY